MTRSNVVIIPARPDPSTRDRIRIDDPRYMDGQRLLVDAMKYLLQSDREANREAAHPGPRQTRAERAGALRGRDAVVQLRAGALVVRVARGVRVVHQLAHLAHREVHRVLAVQLYLRKRLLENGRAVGLREHVAQAPANYKDRFLVVAQQQARARVRPEHLPHHVFEC